MPSECNPGAVYIRQLEDRVRETEAENIKLEGEVERLTLEKVDERAVNQRLEADKARLDWLEQNEADLVCIFWKKGFSIENHGARHDPPHWMVCPEGDLIPGADDLPNVRAAIDAGIAAQNHSSHKES